MTHTHHGARDGRRCDLGLLLLVVRDVDGHGVVAEAPHLVGGEVLVRGLPEQVLLACNIIRISHSERGQRKRNPIPVTICAFLLWVLRVC